MAILAGKWGAPTIDGPRILAVDGIEFHIPEDADVKFVSAGRVTIAHVRVFGFVIVLSAQGQLIEAEADARARAAGHNWGHIAGDSL